MLQYMTVLQYLQYGKPHATRSGRHAVKVAMGRAINRRKPGVAVYMRERTNSAFMFLKNPSWYHPGSS